MLKLFKNDNKTPINDQIHKVLFEMHKVGIDSAEYPKLMTYLERLHEIKMQEHSKPVSRDTIAIVAGNLLGILVIVAYEQKHVITSKGINQIIRPNTPR